MSRFRNETAFRHDSQERMGVLLVNLGTPDEPTTKAVRRYLAEFLWDPRVVEVPRPLWWLILHLGILRFRPARSAESTTKEPRPNQSASKIRAAAPDRKNMTLMSVVTKRSIHREKTPAIVRSPAGRTMLRSRRTGPR